MISRNNYFATERKLKGRMCHGRVVYEQGGGLVVGCGGWMGCRLKLKMSDVKKFVVLRETMTSLNQTSLFVWLLSIRKDSKIVGEDSSQGREDNSVIIVIIASHTTPIKFKIQVHTKRAYQLSVIMPSEEEKYSEEEDVSKPIDLSDEALENGVVTKNEPNGGANVIEDIPWGTRMWEVFTTFWPLGFIAFGGPQAHIAILRDHLVVQRDWMDEEAFTGELLSCQSGNVRLSFFC